MNKFIGGAALVIVIIRGVIGAVYIADCRQSGAEFKECWNEGYKMSGFETLGLAAGGFLAGFWTKNPALDR